MTDPAAPAPLDGVRVCDVTQNLAGPFCGQILADLGADVIKVEPPGGDLGRRWGPPFWDGESTLFLSANRGKRSVVIDLKAAEGMEVLRRLASSCDVFMQASRPSAAERLGIDYERVRTWRQDIVHLSVSAYGPDGPMRDQPGYDPLMQAYSGIMSVTGPAGGPPARVGGSVVDFGTGMWAAIAVLGALRTRDATGRGARLDCSLLDTSLAWVSYHLMGYLATGDVPTAMGTGLASIAPYRAFETRDGHVMIAAGNDAIFMRLCEVLELEELAREPRFASNPDRVANREPLDAAIEARTRAWTTADILSRAREVGVPASAIRSMDEVAADAQVDAVGMLTPAPHHALPDYRDVSLPLRIDGRRPRAPAPPPAAGTHTREVLGELGYDSSDIERLLREETVAVSRERSPRESR